MSCCWCCWCYCCALPSPNFAAKHRPQPSPFRLGQYYGLAILVFQHYEPEGVGQTIWHTIYYITVTVTTVGYGDLAPKSDAGRCFGFFFILFGIGCIFTIVAEFGNWILEKVQKRALDAMDDDGLSTSPGHGQPAKPAHTPFSCSENRSYRY